MKTKQNPFLAGMRATGKSEWEKPEDRKEYEAGYMAVHDITDALELLSSIITIENDMAREDARRIMADVESKWSRIKSAIECEVKL